MTLRAVFFDLDDTLCDAKTAFAASVSAAFAAIRARYPRFTDEQLADNWRALHGPLFADLAASRRSMAEVRQLRFRLLLASLGVPDDDFADEIDMLLGETQLGLLTLFDDVSVLEDLRARGLHVGVITNGAGDAHPDSQRSKAARLGLLERVDSFWVSDEIGYRKPDTRAFWPSLIAIGIDPAEALFVGDSYENDIVGASQAGLATAFLQREADPEPHSEKCKPDYIIRSLNEVIAIVAAYSRKPEWYDVETFGEFDSSATYVDRKAAYAIILRDENVAVVKSGNGKYFLPGGGALPGETAAQTVLREIREELGCDARITRWLGEAEQYFYAVSDACHYRMDAAFVIAELIGEPNQPIAPGEEELHWLPLAEARKRLFHACHSWTVKMVGLGFCGHSI